MVTLCLENDNDQVQQDIFIGFFFLKKKKKKKITPRRKKKKAEQIVSLYIRKKIKFVYNQFKKSQHRLT
jgi:hypothetical protein